MVFSLFSYMKVIHTTESTDLYRTKYPLWYCTFKKAYTFWPTWSPTYRLQLFPMYFFVRQSVLFAEALYDLQGRESLSSVVPYVFFRLPISLFAETLYDLQGRESLSRNRNSLPMCTSAVSTARQRWASTLANRSNARHRSNIRAWESVWPEGQESIHS